MSVTEGMKRLVWHQFTSSPAATGVPGQEYFAGTHLNSNVTWWNAGAPFFLYLNRIHFLMQQASRLTTFSTSRATTSRTSSASRQTTPLMFCPATTTT
jgi:hypothetical protein